MGIRYLVVVCGFEVFGGGVWVLSMRCVGVWVLGIWWCAGIRYLVVVCGCWVFGGVCVYELGIRWCVFGIWWYVGIKYLVV